MKKVIAGHECEVNEEGFLLDSHGWTEEIAQEIATELGITTLTPEHMAVLAWLRAQHAMEIPMTLRKIGSSGVTDIKKFYALFPGKPLKYASKIAGVPKPASCI